MLKILKRFLKREHFHQSLYCNTCNSFVAILDSRTNYSADVESGFKIICKECWQKK